MRKQIWELITTIAGRSWALRDGDDLYPKAPGDTLVIDPACYGGKATVIIIEEAPSDD